MNLRRLNLVIWIILFFGYIYSTYLLPGKQEVNNLEPIAPEILPTVNPQAITPIEETSHVYGVKKETLTKHILLLDEESKQTAIKNYLKLHEDIQNGVVGRK